MLQPQLRSYKLIHLASLFPVFYHTSDLVCFSLLPSPCIFCSLFVFAGAALAVRAALKWRPNNKDQSCFTAAVALTKAREVSQNIRQNGCQKHPCYSITGVFTAHRFIKDASTVSGTRGRQQCDKTQPCPTGYSVCPCFPLVGGVSGCVSGLTGFKTSALW